MDAMTTRHMDVTVDDIETGSTAATQADFDHRLPPPPTMPPPPPSPNNFTVGNF